MEDNERLEFLGDAVLDFVVGAWVYNRFPEMPEGDLTKMRSALVRNDQLAALCRVPSIWAARCGWDAASCPWEATSAMCCSVPPSRR